MPALKAHLCFAGFAIAVNRCPAILFCEGNIGDRNVAVTRGETVIRKKLARPFWGALSDRLVGMNGTETRHKPQDPCFIATSLDEDGER